jgi:hypothetical protein
MNNLASGMDPGIGTASSYGLDRTMGVKSGNRLFEGLLHARTIALPLPTMKRAAVVLDAEGNPAQG